jgi:hypothetical protein
MAPALISKPEEVPSGAVDSSGQPVDALLYAATWGLQPLLHNPREATAPDTWWGPLGFGQLQCRTRMSLVGDRQAAGLTRSVPCEVPDQVSLCGRSGCVRLHDKADLPIQPTTLTSGIPQPGPSLLRTCAPCSPP